MRSLAPLLGAALVVLVLPVVHVLVGEPPTELEVIVAGYVPMIFVLLWMIEDAYRRRSTPCFDFGFLICVLFPLSLLGYLVWTRGWWGLVVFAGMLAAIYVPWFVGTALTIVISG
jgi:hypothetical protein